MKPDLIVIANSGMARLFTRAAVHDPLVALATLEPAETHPKGSELDGERPGHGSSDTRPGGVSFEPRLDLQRKHQLQFAHTVARRIDAVLAEHGCGRLSLFASSPFLGELKGALSDAALKHLGPTINLDLTRFGLDEIERRIAKEAQLHHPPGA